MPPKTQYTPQQLIDMLKAGSHIEGSGPVMAAVHLLVFTELPHLPGFERTLDIEHTPDGDVAYVKDWESLASSDLAVRAGTADTKLLTIAAGLHTGRLTHLRDNVIGLDHAHTQRLVQAILIAAGYDDAERTGLFLISDLLFDHCPGCAASKRTALDDHPPNA